MNQAAGLFVYALVALFVIIDPIGTAVFFSALTTGDTAEKRRVTARKATVIGFIVLSVFGLAGEALLRVLGITIPALQIAGGALLFLSATDMVTARGELRATDEEREAARTSSEDISVFPLAIPFIAGPGAMTTMVLLHSKAVGQAGGIAVIELALGAIILGTFIAMMGARHLARLMGETGAHVIGRVLGILLAALAAQFIIEGLRSALKL
ncbi:MAG TPA: MarC family protein [Acetobacteraceae bacterium]|nr:MarC family protein [Acetobacteraceae bacterium]